MSTVPPLDEAQERLVTLAGETLQFTLNQVCERLLLADIEPIWALSTMVVSTATISANLSAMAHSCTKTHNGTVITNDHIEALAERLALTFKQQFCTSYFENKHTAERLLAETQAQFDKGSGTTQ